MTNKTRSLFQAAFICLFSLTTILPVIAQEPELEFQHLKVEDGLSQSTVRTIFQDHMGFMWFGTDIGINKFDGSEFTVYKYDAADSSGLPSNFIIDLFEDSYGVFWIGTGYSGLSRFDREQEIFHNYRHQPGESHSLSDNNIRVIFEDSKKNLWIGTAGGGLNLYNRETDSFTCYKHDSLNTTDIGSNYISDIGEDKKGNLWFASPEGILIKYDPASGIWKKFDLFRKQATDKFTTTFCHLLIDSENDVWFGTETGVFLYDQESQHFTHFQRGNTNRNLNENAISDIEEYGNGIFLIATDHGGLNVYNKHTGIFKYYRHSREDESSISNDQLYCIYKSANGIFWIGNYHGGINIYDSKATKFHPYNHLINDESNFSVGSVLTICEDEDHQVWFGYDGQGIDIYNPATRSVRHLKSIPGNRNTILSDVVVEIFKASNGDIWVGTYLRGMSVINRKTGKYRHFLHDPNNPNSIGSNNVWSIFEDSEGYFWIGLHGSGLDKYDPRTGIFRHYRHNSNDSLSLINNDIYKIFEDRDKNVWVSTRNGLCLYNRNTDNFTSFVSSMDSRGIFGICVYDLYEDDRGNIWIGTDQALNLFNKSKRFFTHFQESDGLNGNAVLSITGDRKGNLWISTNKGLSRFNIKNRKFRNYDITDGLQSNEFNYISVLNSSNGMMYFGGKNGFNFFYPDSIFDNPLMPPVYLTKLTVINSVIGPRNNSGILSKHINFEKQIVLNHNHSVVTFEFAALNYSNSRRNQYSYMLENFDKNWVYIGNKHEVTYTNLNPGKYIFRVRGSNNDGIWNEEGALLQVTVLPPWWRTIWFRVFLYISIFGLILLVYYIRLAFYQNQQKKLLVLVRERTFQLEEVAVTLEEKQEEINSQNEKLMSQRDELEGNNKILTEQKKQILDQNKELDQHRNQLESLVEERTKELIAAKNKAEESDRLKSSFLANLSHEIRTPLNAILGFSSLLGERNLTDAEREEYNRIIQGSSNTLLDLISDILDISKIEAGQLELDLQEVSLEAILSDLVGIFDMFMSRDDIGSNKQVELKVAIDDDIRSVFIFTDNLRLTQVLSNLINNAIKFTSKGFIEVGCKKMPDAEMLEFYVKDTGIGIKPEHQQMIFERFRKVEEDKSQLHRGTGLGLAISYQLVNLMGGSMHLTSTFGEGSVFYFTIPLIKSDNPYVAPEEKMILASLPDYKDCKILVAEDDISNYHYIERLLSKVHIDVVHAENGKQVITIMQSMPDIRLILMDIKMPIMDGIETLHELRRLNFTLPVIAQTAYALADEVVKLKREGFDEYISKPIQRESIYPLISKFL
jgi:signal transduction histidine kinase/ligand-binding sensor domain-containing protein/CheY-like chemotaxis protein